LKRPCGSGARVASLLGAAIAAGAATSANAQSTVSISGLFNTAVVHRDLRVQSQPDVRSTKLDSTESKLIFRGTEDLGGGLSARFMMAGGFRVDTGAGSFCSGDCWVGLTGAFGSIRLGHTLPIYDDVSLPWYFVEAAGNHNPASLWANCGNKAGMADGCVDNYLSKTVRYDSPRFDGFSGSVSTSDPSGDLAGPPRRARVNAAGVEYRSGPWYVGAAHQRQYSLRSVDSFDAATTLSFWFKSWLTVGVGIENLRYSVPGGGSLERTYGGLLVHQTTGPHTLWLNIGLAGNGYGDAAEGSSVNAISKGHECGARMWTIGYRYRLSKSMQAYAYWNEIVNDRNGRYSFDAPPAGGPGWRISALAVGMSKRF